MFLKFYYFHNTAVENGICVREKNVELSQARKRGGTPFKRQKYFSARKIAIEFVSQRTRLYRL